MSAIAFATTVSGVGNLEEIVPASSAHQRGKPSRQSTRNARLNGVSQVPLTPPAFRPRHLRKGSGVRIRRVRFESCRG